MTSEHPILATKPRTMDRAAVEATIAEMRAAGMSSKRIAKSVPFFIRMTRDLTPCGRAAWEAVLKG